jgi:peptide/nickel transport system substrate-binding protein
MDTSYWSKIVGQHVRRRTALQAAGAGTAAAVFLAACGGGSDNEANSNKSNLVAQPVDTFKDAKRGGTLKDRTFGDPNTMDIASAINPLNPAARIAYDTLVRFNVGVNKPSDNSIIGGLAESYEKSPDGLQITMKLRQGLKWHNKPPVNGRAFDADDVLFTWDRFTKKSTNRGGYANAVNPQAPILSVTASDARTIVVKLKEPLVYALELFASNPISFSGSLIVIPKETDTTFNIGTDMIGTGPYTMTNYSPSVGFTLKRNPDYFDKDWGLVEQIDMPIVLDYAAVLAQLKAGNIYSFGASSNIPGAKAEDILTIKQEEPRIQIYPKARVAGANPSVLSFGLLPDGKSPFVDERVRQAVSMSWDRDLYADTFFNVSAFTAQGMPVDARWHSSLSDAWEGWWLDPKGKDFGPNAKYYQRDITEAKKLLAAAGFPNGLKDITSHHITTGELGPTFAKMTDVMDGMTSDIGISTKVHPIDYAKEYIPLYRDGHGQYEGWAYHTSAGGTGVGPVGLLSNEYWSKGGSAFHGFSTKGQNDQSGDPQIDAMIEKARIEQDTEKRRVLVQDIQRSLAKSTYALLFPADATEFNVAWPALANYAVYSGIQVWGHYHLWIDETKPPFKSA